MVELAALVPDFCASSNPIDIAERLSGEENYSHGICMYGYSNYSHKGFRKHRLVYEDVPSFDGQASGSQLGGAGVAISSKVRTRRRRLLRQYCCHHQKFRPQLMAEQADNPEICWLGRTEH